MVKKDGHGEAYAFFDCSSSKADIESEIPTIRELVKTPNALELSLTDGINPEQFTNPELRSIADDAKIAGLRYCITARLSPASNKKVADELSGILNQAYQSPLYQDGEQFRGGIFYQRGNKYVSRG